MCNLLNYPFQGLIALKNDIHIANPISVEFKKLPYFKEIAMAIKIKGSHLRSFSLPNRERTRIRAIEPSTGIIKILKLECPVSCVIAPIKNGME